MKNERSLLLINYLLNYFKNLKIKRLINTYITNFICRVQHHNTYLLKSFVYIQRKRKAVFFFCYFYFVSITIRTVINDNMNTEKNNENCWKCRTQNF